MEVSLDSSGSALSHAQSDALRRHGFTEPGSEAALQGMVRLAAAFCGAPVVLNLTDESGIWLLEVAGFLEAEDPALIPILGGALDLAQAGGSFEYEDCGKQTLKGIAQPVRVYRIKGVRRTVSRTRRRRIDFIACRPS